MGEHPNPVAGALVINNTGEILLIKSHKWVNGEVHSIPGGRIEFGETIKDAVEREVKEEVGLDVDFEKILFLQEAIKPKEYYKGDKHFIFFECICKANSTQVKLDNREIQDSIWIKPNEALELNLDSYTRKFIEEYLRVG